ncbi:hypothetical protein DO97_17465, partial [Neosynechococcus sphagnicola sy1]
SLEAAVIEVASKLQGHENSAIADDPASPSNLNVTFDTEPAECSITATIPITVTINPTAGRPTMVANKWILSSGTAAYTTFTKGDGDLDAPNLESAFVEALVRLQIAEQEAIESNPDSPNNISITFDTDALEMSVTATLPMTFSVDGTTGAPVFVAAAYIDESTPPG